MKLKCKYYLRYADDLVILSENKEKLKYIKEQIRQFLKNNLDISLSTHKTYINAETNKYLYFIIYIANKQVVTNHEHLYLGK